MVAQFGARRRAPGQNGWSLAWLGSVMVVLAGAGCAGKDLVVAGERPRDQGGDEDPEGPAGANGAVPSPEVTLTGECPPSLEEREAMAPLCWPSPHAGVWRGFFIGAPRYETLAGDSAEFPEGDVVLSVYSSALTSITFGAAPVSTAAGDEPVGPCPPIDGVDGCPPAGLLIPGRAYQLVDLALFDPELAPESRVRGEPPRQRAERMEFRVRVGEPWDAWCGQREPEEEPCAGGECVSREGLPAAPADVASARANLERSGCRCDAAGCLAEGPSLSIVLRMSDDRVALRGTYTPSDPRIGAARIDLAKETNR